MRAVVARKDVSATLAALSKMLEAVLIPWDVRISRFPKKETPVDLAQTMLPPLLSDLEHNPDYGFLRGEPEFAKLIQDYRAKCLKPTETKS